MDSNTIFMENILSGFKVAEYNINPIISTIYPSILTADIDNIDTAIHWPIPIPRF